MANIKTNAPKIVPCLVFNSNTHEAVKFYTSVFKRSKILQITRYGSDAPMPKGSILTIVFQLEGQKFLALNGGPDFKFNEAVSLMVNCATQEEIDYYWQHLSKGGKLSECGWLKDKFGLSWQIVPENINDMLSDKNPEKASRVLQAIMKMKKIEIKTLKEAYSGKKLVRELAF